MPAQFVHPLQLGESPVALYGDAYRGERTENRMRPIRGAVKCTIALPAIYRFARRVERRLLQRLLAPVGRHAFVVQAFGEPAATVDLLSSQGTE